MWVEIHGLSGRVQLEELTEEGIREAIYQCQQLIKALEALEWTEVE